MIKGLRLWTSIHERFGPHKLTISEYLQYDNTYNTKF
jgi:hypothetical protein